MSSVLEQKQEREERRRVGGREEGGGWCVQRRLYVSVSAGKDGCCSVLARQRFGEKKRKLKNKKGT